MHLGPLLLTTLALLFYFSKLEVKHLRKKPALAAGSLLSNIAFNPGTVLRTFWEIFFFPIFSFCCNPGDLDFDKERCIQLILLDTSSAFLS